MVNSHTTRERIYVTIPIEEDFIQFSDNVPRTFVFYHYDHDKVLVTAKDGQTFPITRVRLWTKEVDGQPSQKFVSIVAKKAIRRINDLITAKVLLQRKIQITKTGEGLLTEYTFAVLPE